MYQLPRNSFILSTRFPVKNQDQFVPLNILKIVKNITTYTQNNRIALLKMENAMQNVEVGLFEEKSGTDLLYVSIMIFF